MKIEQAFPLILPSGWTPQPKDIHIDKHIMHVLVFRPPRGYAVLASIDLLEDKKRWLHLSVSRPDRLPFWEDLREVKNTLLGPEKVAIQLLPKESEYVNAHQYTLHLWHCLEGPTAGPWG